MQHDGGDCPGRAFWFQSSPGPKAQCNFWVRVCITHLKRFQSSPGPKAQCNNTPPTVISITPRSNPHQALRPSATCELEMAEPERRCSNPHQALRPSATFKNCTHLSTVPLFQSSPGPKAQCNQAAFEIVWANVQFQSSPGPKAQCNLRLGITKQVFPRFQSSPGPKAQCNL